MPNQASLLPGTQNTRDLGGYALPGGGATRSRVLLRSDHLARTGEADAALLARAVENLLHNAACHNPGPVQVQLSAVRTGKTLRITIADDGAGYPPAVLHALQTGEAGENTPHILGLHVVEQIIRAHGGTAAFARNAPRGAKAVLVLPVTEDPDAR